MVIRRGRQLVRRVLNGLHASTIGFAARDVGEYQAVRWATDGRVDSRSELARLESLFATRRDMTPAGIVGGYLRGMALIGSETEPRYDWFPDRAVIDRASAHVPKRVRTHMNKPDLTVRDDLALLPVIEACREGRSSTWLNPDVVAAWLEVEKAGHTRTWVVCRGTQMLGGMWGLSIGRTFGIMSMFHREPNAGAVAMGSLVADLGNRWDLIDCGVRDGNWSRYGAFEVPVEEFTTRVLAGLASAEPPSA